MYALIDFKGRQHKVEKGATITVDLISGNKGDTVTVDTVVFVNNDGNVTVGSPYVKGAKVILEVQDNFRSKKVLVFKHKSKKDYHRLHGHRQNYTNVIVKDITVA